MNSPARNALRLKMAGLILTLAGFVALRCLPTRSRISKSPWPLRRATIFIAGAWLVAAHLFAVGLIVLLAGLKDVPLLTSARARRGALQKLAGSTLIILCFGYAGLMDTPAFAYLEELWWVLLPSLALFLISARVGFQLLRSGWKYDVVSAEQLLASDPRRPVVYLRSFEADSEIVLRPDGFWKKAATILFDYAVTFSPEQELAEIVNRVGPVIAIGKPGEPLPELGAARALCRRCGLEGEGHRHDGAVPPRAHTHRFDAKSGVGDGTGDDACSAPADSAREPRRCKKDSGVRPVLQTALWPGASIRHDGRDATLDEADVRGKACRRQDHLLRRGAEPTEEPIRLSVSWVGLAVGLMRPYRDSIQTAMKHVFLSLELPWVRATARPRRSCLRCSAESSDCITFISAIDGAVSDISRFSGPSFRCSSAGTIW